MSAANANAHSALTDPECPNGYPVTQLERELTAEEMAALNKWMYGQTFMICDGRRYSHEHKQHEASECQAAPHNEVYYTHDVRRWLARQPVID